MPLKFGDYYDCARGSCCWIVLSGLDLTYHVEILELDDISNRLLRNTTSPSKNKVIMAHHRKENPSKKARRRKRIARERAAELQQGDEGEDIVAETGRGLEGRGWRVY